jgi:hypothetical protein
MTAFVHLSDNGLSGAIPSALGTMSSQSVLELDGNFFDGPVPPEIGLLKLLGTSLYKCSVSVIRIVSHIRSFPAELNLGRLHLTGSIPEQVCALRDGVLDIFVGPCETDAFRCSVPDCCTECES